MEKINVQELTKLKQEKEKELEEKKKKLEELRKRRQDRLAGEQSPTPNLNTSLKHVDIHTAVPDENRIKRPQNLTRITNVADIAIASKIFEQYDKSIQSIDTAVGPDSPAPSPSPQPAPVPPRESLTTPSNAEVTKPKQQVIPDAKEFSIFLESAAKKIEKSLGAKELVDEWEEVLMKQSPKNAQKTLLHSLCTLSSKQKLADRPITDIKFSPLLPNTLLASYGQESSLLPSPEHGNLFSMHNTNSLSPPGLVALWSLSLRSRPDILLTSTSPVLTAHFSPEHPSLVIGGTYSGALLLWDCRARTTPVQRTSLGSRTHAHPISSLHITGSQASQTIISVSSDGRLCTWLADNLSSPYESIDLKSRNKDLLVCESLLLDSNSLLFGGQDGAMSLCNLATLRKGVSDTVDGHLSGITGMSGGAGVAGKGGERSHLLRRRNDLALTSSFDWTVRLWQCGGSSIKQLGRFDGFNEVVADVKFCPLNSMLFSALTCGGEVSLWNLGAAKDKPVSTYSLADKNVVPNKLAWNQLGSILSVADAQGNIECLSVHDSAIYSTVENVNMFDDYIADITKKD